MFKNYLKIALRNIIRQKGYSFINIFGLAVGLSCFILISLWVKHEMSYDQFHEKRDRIFRLLNSIDNGNFGASVSYALGPELKAKYPEIEESCRVWPWHRSLVKYQGKRFDENRFYLTDPSFFSVFTFPFILGNAETALLNRNSLVITEAAAQRYFGEKNPIGKTLHLAQPGSDFKVTGVIKNIPLNSSLQFDFVARVEHLGEDRIRRWEEWVASSYVLLRTGTKEIDVENKINGIYKEHLSFKPNFWPVLQPLTKVHFYEYGQPGLIKQVVIFSIIAIFILLIACINFMNLSTARSIKRVKEVGIRKVTGANRFQLIKQFLGESFILSYLALVLSLILVQIVLPVFNTFTGKQLSLVGNATNYLIFLFFVVAPVTGIMAGCYPAFHLSAFHPADVLKIKRGSKKGSSFFRRILVIVQFSISIGLIISTFVIAKQLQFIRKKDLGLDRNHVVILMNNKSLSSKFDVFKSELERQLGVLHVTAAAQRPMDVGQGISVDWNGRQGDERFVIKYTVVDYDFFRTFDIKFIAGRSFLKSISSDFTEACIINESLAKQIGEGSPIGQKIYFDHPSFSEAARYVNVIGVTNDFHSESLHNSIQPFIFRIHRPFHQYVFIKIKPHDIPGTLERIKYTFEQFSPEYPFGYRFLNEAFENQYTTEKQLSQLFHVFGTIAIFISCLGLLGLVSFLTEQRTKEIGIRKVLGASVKQVVFLISNEFVKLVLLANIVAWPVAYIVMHNWLQNFAYRLDLSIWIFILSGLAALMIALLTVSYQSIKAAITNPINSLRCE